MINKIDNNKQSTPKSIIALILYFTFLPLYYVVNLLPMYGSTKMPYVFEYAILNTLIVFVLFTLPFLIYRYLVKKSPVSKSSAYLFSILYCLTVTIVLSLVFDKAYGAGWITIFIDASILYCGKKEKTHSSNDIAQSALAPELDQKVIEKNIGIAIQDTHITSSDTEMPEVSKEKNEPNHTIEPSEYELQMRREYNRYTYLRQEVHKIPIQDVRMWHDNGNLTDIQYEKICSVYNSMKIEMKDIRKRVQLLNQTNAYQLTVGSETDKKKVPTQRGKTPYVVAWCSSIMLILCVIASGISIYQLVVTNEALEKEVVKQKNLYSSVLASRDSAIRDYKTLLTKYSMLESSYSDSQSEKSDYAVLENKYCELLDEYNILSNDYSNVVANLSYYKTLYDQVSTKTSSTVKIGDSQNTVLDICGSPDRMEEQFKDWGSKDGWKWYYGTSYFLFDEYYNTVEAWYIGDTHLPVG